MDNDIFPPHHMMEFGCLGEEEVARLRALGGVPVHLARDSVIRPQGSQDRSVYHLVEGWVSASMLLRDGQRQIVKLHLPGDLLGSTSMCFDAAIDTLTALTPITVRKIALEAFGGLIVSSPRIAAYTILSAQRERVALMDRLASIGRSDAAARIAALFLDLNSRLGLVGLSSDDTFRLPMTQEQLGDHLGLTSVHVNRVLHLLERDGLLERTRSVIRIPNLSRLQEVAAIIPRTVSSNLDWLGFAGDAGPDARSQDHRIAAQPT